MEAIHKFPAQEAIHKISAQEEGTIFKAIKAILKSRAKEPLNFKAKEPMKSRAKEPLNFRAKEPMKSRAKEPINFRAKDILNKKAKDAPHEWMKGTGASLKNEKDEKSDLPKRINNFMNMR